jgi:hypothetical protein
MAAAAETPSAIIAVCLGDRGWYAMKKDLLRQAGYDYDFNHMLYFNRQAKKAFSVEFVDDNDEGELEKRIREDLGRNGWRFYFNSPPSESVKRELERALG